MEFKVGDKVKFNSYALNSSFAKSWPEFVNENWEGTVINVQSFSVLKVYPVPYEYARCFREPDEALYAVLEGSYFIKIDQDSEKEPDIKKELDIYDEILF